MDNNPFPDSPVMPTMFDGSKAINFRCHRDIGCWNACCSNIDISLTPYDVLRLKQRLELGSGEFLNTYTVPYEIEKDGLAGVKLRPVDGGTACRFMTPEGCGVYSDRPTACRYYPVALLSMRKQDEYIDQNSYALVQEPHCLGHQDPRSITVNDYRAEQGLPEYDDLARGWRQLILKKKSSGPSIGKPSKRSLQLFFMACYDLDRFREFVASEGFSDLFDIPDEELLKILGDDVNLLEFAFRFLRQTLFGETSIALRAESVEKRKERQQERNLRLEREAAERMEREEDSGFDEDLPGNSCSSN
ncbi:MAG: YkgJ family cysteine cluster protein [Betaproteobacteria bacterium]|nr:YkgJ family cysteine cluster protein [Betaproteobacteria bacterium]